MILPDTEIVIAPKSSIGYKIMENMGWKTMWKLEIPDEDDLSAGLSDFDYVFNSETE